MKAFIRLSALLLAAVPIAGCGGPSDEQVEGDGQNPVLELPGTICRPDTSGFIAFPTDSLEGVLLYLWIPLENCDQSDADLVFLATLEESGILPAPVQFDQTARNFAQRFVNGLELPLTVYLGDDELLSFMNVDILPAAVLVLPGGVEIRASGAGCARRVLQDLQ